MKTRLLQVYTVYFFHPLVLTSGEIEADQSMVVQFEPSYNREIRGILTKYCVDCHGPDKQKGDMRLDEIDPDVVRGKPSPL